AQGVTDSQSNPATVPDAARWRAARGGASFCFAIKQLVGACYAPLMNLAEHLLGQAALALHGSRIAFRCEGSSITYADLAQRVARASAAFRTLGLAPGERVLLLLRDTPEFAVAWLGAVHAGGVAIGLNTRLSEAEYRHVCDDSRVRISVVEDRFVLARPDLAAEFAQNGTLVVEGESNPPGTRSWRE